MPRRLTHQIPAPRHLRARPLARGGLILLAMLLAGPAAGGDSTLYKWVDSQGNVHYSDKPRSPGAEALGIRSARTDPDRIQAMKAAEAEAEQTAAEQADAEQAEGAEQAALDARNAEIRAGNCEKARKLLAQLETARRPHRIDENGEHQYLSAEQIDQERIEAQAAIDEFCN